jgi:hypothetical protein
MHIQFYSLFVLLLALLVFGCAEKSTGPATTANVIFEEPGCRPSYANKALAFGDSCFSYQFQDLLVVDFCVSANCCPDSNRFSIDHMISADTITVTIADTAARLCRCMCRHWIHAAFYGLVSDNYTFVVYQRDSLALLPLYRVAIHRN